MKTRMRIPSRFVRIDRVAGTVAVRGKKGLFKGRKKVKGKGDKTANIRLIRSVDLNKDGRIGKSERGGTIRGRTRIYVKGSQRARGYQKTV